ncbi:MAG: flagellar biosynthetic protein FliO [Gammaproteobacteria bacterium]|nr:flagellar biosynthetic protein FliO [Gammaproteobacteria bacterium]
MFKIPVFLLFMLIELPQSLAAETLGQINKIPQAEPLSVMNVLNMVMGLVVVIALILGLAWVLRKYGRLPINNQVEMKVLGGLSLGTRERAVLIQVEGHRILLGVAPGRVDTLHVLDKVDTVQFENTLSQVMDEKR